MAALHVFGDHRASVFELRRNALGHRVLSFGFLERAEMESTLFCRPLRIVDLRRLRLRRFGDTRSATAGYSIHRDRKKFCPAHRDSCSDFELDLFAFATARFVLSPAQIGKFRRR